MLWLFPCFGWLSFGVSTFWLIVMAPQKSSSSQSRPFLSSSLVHSIDIHRCNKTIEIYIFKSVYRGHRCWKSSNRLLKVCNVLSTSASLSRLLFFANSTNEANKAGDTRLSSLYYLDVYDRHRLFSKFCLLFCWVSCCCSKLTPKWRHFCPSSPPTKWHHFLFTLGVTNLSPYKQRYVHEP